MHKCNKNNNNYYYNDENDDNDDNKIQKLDCRMQKAIEWTQEPLAKYFRWLLFPNQKVIDLESENCRYDE